MKTQRAKFSSKIGIIAASVGSAIGLGNIWRFPTKRACTAAGHS